MSGVLVLLVVVVMALFVVGRTRQLLRRRIVLPGRLLPPPGSVPAAEAFALLAALRRRGGLSVLALVAVAAAMLAVQAGWPSGAGLPLVLAPSLALLVLVAIQALFPLPDELAPAASTTTRADITTRRARTFGPAWGYALPSLLLAATLATLVVAGLRASPDVFGRSREFGYIIQTAPLPGQMGPASGAVSPFPGWYYGIPVIVLLAVSALLFGCALHRNAQRPRLRASGLVAFDDAVRTCVGFALSAGASALIGLQLAMLALMAGQALVVAARSASEGVDLGLLSSGLALLGLSLLLLGGVAALGATFLSWILGNRRSSAGHAGYLPSDGSPR